MSSPERCGSGPSADGALIPYAGSESLRSGQTPAPTIPVDGWPEESRSMARWHPRRNSIRENSPRCFAKFVGVDKIKHTFKSPITTRPTIEHEVHCEVAVNR